MRMLPVIFLLLSATAVRAGDREAVPEVSVFGPDSAETTQIGLNIRSKATSGFVLMEHGRSSSLMVPDTNEGAVAVTSPESPALPKFSETKEAGLDTPSDNLSAAILAPHPPYLKLKASQVQRRQALSPVVAAAADRHRLPVGLVDAVILAESRYEPFAVSHAGAGGMMQLMPGTAADLGVRNRFNPIVNIEAGTRYLRQMIDSMGSIRLGVAAYNAGMRSVRRAGGIPNNGETPTYVSRVLGYWSAMAGQNPVRTSAITQATQSAPKPVTPRTAAGIQIISPAEIRHAFLMRDEKVEPEFLISVNVPVKVSNQSDEEKDLK
jgi:hypothetical protein